MANCWRTLVRNLLISDEWCLVTWVKVIVSSIPCAVWLCLRISVSPPGVRYIAGKARDSFCVAACLDAAWDSEFPQRVAAQVRLIGGTAVFVKLWRFKDNTFFLFLFYSSTYILFCLQLQFFFCFCFPIVRVWRELRSGHN